MARAWKCAACRSAVAVARPERVQPLHRELPHRLEEAEARLVVGGGHPQHERLVDERAQRGQHVGALAGDGLDRVEREPAAEHRQPLEEVDLLGLEQVHAPVEHRGHRAVPLGQVARAGADLALRQSFQQGGRREQPQARSGQLEGEGEAVELPGDGGEGRGVVVGDLRGGAGGRGPVEQQGDGGGAGHGLDVVGGRRGQRAQHHLVLGAHPQWRTARRQHDEVGAAGDQVGEHRRGPGELLEVVEHEQHPQALQVPHEGVERVGVRGLGQAPGPPRSAG